MNDKVGRVEQTNSFEIGLRVDQARPIDVHLAMQKEEARTRFGPPQLYFRLEQ